MQESLRLPTKQEVTILDVNFQRELQRKASERRTLHKPSQQKDTGISEAFTDMQR